VRKSDKTEEEKRYDRDSLAENGGGGLGEWGGYGSLDGRVRQPDTAGEGGGTKVFFNKKKRILIVRYYFRKKKGRQIARVRGGKKVVKEGREGDLWRRRSYWHRRNVGQTLGGSWGGGEGSSGKKRRGRLCRGGGRQSTRREKSGTGKRRSTHVLECRKGKWPFKKLMGEGKSKNGGAKGYAD